MTERKERRDRRKCKMNVKKEKCEEREMEDG